MRSGQSTLRPAVLVLLVGLIVLAAMVRMRGLDASFHGDEIFHVVAAESLLDGRGPTLATNYSYRRALLQTRLVASSMNAFGRSEWAARLPSFLASLLAILLVFEIGRRWFDPAVGMVAAIYLSFEPMSVHFGTSARFYALLQVMVLLAALAGDRILVHAGNTRPFSRETQPGSILRLLLWSVLAGAALALALSLSVLAADLLAGVALFALARVGLGLVGFRGGVPLRSPEGVLLVAGGMAMVVLPLAAPDLIHRLREVAMTAPPWNQREGLAPLFYAYHLRDQYPLAWLLMPLGALFAFLRHHRYGLLLAGLFLAPLVIHSLLFRPKSPHYLFPLQPFFFLLAAIALVEVARLVFHRLAVEGWQRPVAVICVLLLGMFILRSSPWFSQGLTTSHDADWRGAVEQIKADIGERDLVVGGVDDDLLAARYYLPHVDAHLATQGWLEYTRPLGWDPERHLAGAGVFDIPSWTDTGSILNALEQHPRAWIVLRSRYVRQDTSLGRMLLKLKARADKVLSTDGGITVMLIEAS